MDLLQIFDLIGAVFDRWGLIIVFLGSLIETSPFGWIVPGGAILVIAGYLSNNNQNLPLISVIISGTLGTWFAFILSYFLGKKTGMWLVKKLKQEKNAAFAKNLLKKNGGVILTTSMLANLTRFWISYIAGVDKYSFSKFSKYAFLASLSWSSLMILLGYFTGYERENIKNIMSGIGILAWIFLGIALFVIYKSIKHEYDHFKKDYPHDESN